MRLQEVTQPGGVRPRQQHPEVEGVWEVSAHGPVHGHDCRVGEEPVWDSLSPHHVYVLVGSSVFVQDQVSDGEVNCMAIMFYEKGYLKTTT